MGRVTDTVGTVNTTLRTLLMLVLVGGAGIAGYKAYELYNEPKQALADKQAELETTQERLKKANSDLEAKNQEVSELNLKLAETAAELEKTKVAKALLAVDQRIARLTVLDQTETPSAEAAGSTEAAPGETADPAAPAVEAPPTNVVTKIEFVEVNESGDPIGEPKQFDIVGDTVYVDYLRVTFDDKYIEEQNLDRSTAIALFPRIFGEHQNAAEGFELDAVGTRPTAYGRGTEMSEFEKKIWDDFWSISNDPQRAAQLGINAAHRTAVGQRLVPGKTYEIKLRSTGDMTIRPIDPERAAVNKNPAPAPPPN
jgi:hypothetical protein